MPPRPAARREGEEEDHRSPPDSLRGGRPLRSAGLQQGPLRGPQGRRRRGRCTVGRRSGGGGRRRSGCKALRLRACTCGAHPPPTAVWSWWCPPDARGGGRAVGVSRRPSDCLTARRGRPQLQPVPRRARDGEVLLLGVPSELQPNDARSEIGRTETSSPWSPDGDGADPQADPPGRSGFAGLFVVRPERPVGESAPELFGVFPWFQGDAGRKGAPDENEP